MEFYNKFSDHYDYIFPFQYPQYNFLKELIKTGDRVLDIACGTGNYIIKICQELDVQGVGIDLDNAMIKKAEQKGAHLENLRLFEKNMLDIGDFEGNFHLVYCIGNSLPHLVEPKTILKMIKEVYQKLSFGGSVILQTVNYNKKPQNLKTIVNDEKGLQFVRNYNYVGNIVEFCTTLKGQDFEVQGKVELYPIQSKELEEMLSSVGFFNIEMFGSFNKEKYDPKTSGSLVVVATK